VHKSATGARVYPGTQITPVVPARFRRELRDLLNQQCWCWGCDVRRDRGNLLVAYGASRVCPPERDNRRSTTYHVTPPGGGWIGLWGFGLAMVPATGLAVFVPRYDGAPRLIVGDTATLGRSWSPVDLPRHERVDTLPAWWSALAAFRWIASYEAWIDQTAESEWREACSRQFDASVVDGRDLRAAWDHLIDRLERQILDASVQMACPA